MQPHNAKAKMLVCIFIAVAIVLSGCSPAPSTEDIQTAIAQTQAAQPTPTIPATPMPLSAIDLKSALMTPADLVDLFGNQAIDATKQCIKIHDKNFQEAVDSAKKDKLSVANISWGTQNCNLDFMSEKYLMIEEAIIIVNSPREAARATEDYIDWYNLVWGSLEEERVEKPDSRLWLSKGVTNWDRVYATHDNAVIMLRFVTSEGFIKEDLMEAMAKAIEKLENQRLAAIK